jgi:hypothetical protein
MAARCRDVFILGSRARTDRAARRAALRGHSPTLAQVSAFGLVGVLDRAPMTSGRQWRLSAIHVYGTDVTRVGSRVRRYYK